MNLIWRVLKCSLEDPYFQLLLSGIDAHLRKKIHYAFIRPTSIASFLRKVANMSFALVKTRKQHHVVISGTAGMFPDCWSVKEFQDRLFNGINLVKPETKTVGGQTFNGGTATLPDIENFDAAFYQMPRKFSVAMDPIYRVALPISFAAICDSGVNPGELSNRMVGVFGSSGVSEFECGIFGGHVKTVNVSTLLGTTRTMMSNRLSFLLNVIGPSFTIHSDWTGLIDGIQYATRLIERGAIESALVVSANIARIPFLSFHYHFMGVLNEDGCSKCFSDDADGYSRTEAAVAFFLQREEDALRSYGRILGTKNTYIGDKTVRINQIPRNLYSDILRDFYSANEIDPSTIAYVEAAGFALKDADAEELNALTEVLLSDSRRSPLLVGSVKSVAGHSEACADGMAILKAVLVANNGLIPKNINFTKPNSLVPALLDGRMKVVTETTPLEGDLIAINAMDGSKILKHLVLERSPKTKKYVPEKPGILPPDGLPRLFLMTGRNEEATQKALSEVEEMPIDPDFIGLSHRLFAKGIRNHIYRGFTVLNDKGSQMSETFLHFTGNDPPPLWFVYTGMGSQWPGMGTDLMKLTTFAKAIHRCHEILKSKGLDLIYIISNPDPKTFDNVLNSMVGIAAVQIGLTDLLEEVGLVPDGMIGHSVGELGCAYADGCFTAEQMILAAYARGKASLEADLIPGTMAAVGKGYQEMKNALPKEIDIACHNGANSCTLSGPTEDMSTLLNELTSKDVFAKLVSTGGIAYHSRYIEPAAPALLEALKEVIPSPKRRSKKWISSSVPESEWESELAQYCSAEYHTNNLLSPVFFEEGSAHVPKDAIIVEVSPHGLLQAILRKTFPIAHNIPLTQRGDSDGFLIFLNALGKIYNRGYPMFVERLYPPVEFPVPRGTPSLGGFINWEMGDEGNLLAIMTKTRKEKQPFTLYGDAWPVLNKSGSLKEFILNGSAFLPISAFIKAACDKRVEQAANQENVIEYIEMSKLKLHTFLSGQKDIEFELSNSFAAFHGTDTVFRADFVESYVAPVWTEASQNSEGVPASPQDFYHHLSYLGLQLGPSLRLIQELRRNAHGVQAKILWNGDLFGFLENVLLLPVFALGILKYLSLVSKIKKLTIDLNKFVGDENEVLTVDFNAKTNFIVCSGLKISNPVLTNSVLTEDTECRFSKVEFLPFEPSGEEDISSFLAHVREIVLNSLILDSINELVIYEIEPKIQMHRHVMEVFKNTLGIPIQVKLYAEDLDLADIQRSQMEKENNLFILNRSDQMKKTWEYLKYSNQGFILLINSEVPSSLGIVASSRIENNLFCLCKIVRSSDEVVPYIYTFSKDWESELQTALDSPANRVVYLVDRSQVFQVQAVTEMCKQFHNYHKIRFIFHDEAELKPHLHIEHIKKDLKINVLHRGKWGSPRITEVCLDSVSPLLERTASFRFSLLKMEGSEIFALGLTKNEHNKNNKFDVVEYSGVEDGKEVCGLGSVNKTALKTIIPDSILRWDKPEDWSHEEISAVLLPYTLAYYMLNISTLNEIIGTTDKRILVHRGSLPISQAVITVALQEKFDVYTTYLGETERQVIQSLFPQISIGNIVSYETRKFSDVLMKKLQSKGQKGFTFVVNTLDADANLALSLNLLEQNGHFFQCTDVETSDNHLGMWIFLNAVTVYGVFPSLLWELGDDIKEILRDCVKKGLSSGQIKPLSYMAQSMDLTNLEAIELLNGTGWSYKRLIVSKRGLIAKETNWFIAERNVTYVVIVDECPCWFTVLEWLTLRGAIRIALVIDLNTLSKILLHKLSTLMTENPLISFLIESVKGNLKNILEVIQTGNKIAAIFILGDEDPSHLQAVCDEAYNAKLFYFTKKQSIDLGNNTRSSLQIIDKNDYLNSYTLTSHLDKLMMARDSVLYVSSKEFGTSQTVDDWSSLSFGHHLPVTASEVLPLAKTPRAPHWKEVRTNTLRYEFCREIQPLFVIPSLKEGSFKQLYAGLFYPAFVAVIPRNVSLEEIAQSLLKELLRYESDVFSLVSSDWGCELGIRLTRLLEENHKTVNLIVFDGSFNWKSKELFGFTQRKVAMQLTESPLSKNKERLIQTGLEVLKERLHLVSADPTPLFSVTTSGLQQRLSSFVILIRNNLSTDHLFNRLQEECGEPVEVVSTEESSFLDMLNSKRVADIINRAVLVDRIRSARPPQRRFSLTYEILTGIIES